MKIVPKYYQYIFYKADGRVTLGCAVARTPANAVNQIVDRVARAFQPQSFSRMEQNLFKVLASILLPGYHTAIKGEWRRVKL